MIPLNTISKNKRFQVLRIRGGRGVLKKTLELGVIPNSKWTLAANSGFGPIVIQNNEMKIGIGHEMAKKIFVKTLEED